jgi:signal transduction histidine kinase
MSPPTSGCILTSHQILDTLCLVSGFEQLIELVRDGLYQAGIHVNLLVVTEITRLREEASVQLFLLYNK